MIIRNHSQTARSIIWLFQESRDYNMYVWIMKHTIFAKWENAITIPAQDLMMHFSFPMQRCPYMAFGDRWPWLFTGHTSNVYVSNSHSEYICSRRHWWCWRTSKHKSNGKVKGNRFKENPGQKERRCGLWLLAVLAMNLAHDEICKYRYRLIDKLEHTKFAFLNLIK